MWIRFVKEAAANERVYREGDTALFQDELGQKMVEGGFAEYFDPRKNLVIGESPKVEGLEGANVAPEPVAFAVKGAAEVVSEPIQALKPEPTFKKGKK